MLMAAAVVVIGMGMVSCVDNIDNSTTPSEKEQQQAAEAQQAKAQKFWAVASHLVDVDDYTDDYADKTFEPTYGVSQGNDGTRYVYTNTAATAAERFGDLVDCDDIDEDTPSYTYDDPDVGTLVYTKGSGRFLATVDVSIKQIPNLKKIVYVPGAYANGSFRGRAYYRFGDVVSREVNGYGGEKVIEYWICVRPSFGPESKDDSHWVCLNVLPEKNVWHYKISNNNEDWLPTGIGTNQEHMQNLAEMLYAIYFSDEWQANVSDNANTKLEMFHDFNKTKYTYHNKYFWMDVRQQWRKQDIVRKALNFTEVGDDFRTMLSGDGIRLLYGGYSWWTKTSWNATLYEAHYQNGAELKERNMHKVSLNKLTHNMQVNSMDCRKMGKDNYDNYKFFFDDDGKYRWTVRHATGKELAAAGTAYDKQGKIQGVEDVYRYYRDVEPTADDAYATTDPEVTTAEVPADEVKVGHLIGNDGKFYRSYDVALEEGNGAVAMVVSFSGDKRVEKDKDWNGLAIALEDIQQLDGKTQFSFCGETEKNELCTNIIGTSEQIPYRLDGWAMTKRMKDKACGQNHSHPAAELTWNKPRIEGEGFSEWFIPSVGQWNLALEGQGISTLNQIIDGYYMTCTEATDMTYDAGILNGIVSTKYWGFLSSSNKFMYSDKSIPDDGTLVRPFVAFRVGNGGNVNPEEPWTPLANPKTGSWLGEDGQFYEKASDAYANTGCMPVAYVAYVGNQGSVVVNGQEYRGLAIGTYPNQFPGLTWYELEEFVKTYKTRLSENVRQQKGFSPWFVGSKEHWKIVFELGFGYNFDEWGFIFDSRAWDTFYNTFENSVRNTSLRGYYWTSTDFWDWAANNEAYFIMIAEEVIGFFTYDKPAPVFDNQEMDVRPMIAF
jgi:hypothetical protein